MNGILDPVGFQELLSCLQEIKRKPLAVLTVRAKDPEGRHFKVYIQYHRANILACVFFLGYSTTGDSVRINESQFIERSTENIYLYFEIVDFTNDSGGITIYTHNRRTRTTPNPMTRIINVNRRRQFGRRRT